VVSELAIFVRSKLVKNKFAAPSVMSSESSETLSNTSTPIVTTKDSFAPEFIFVMVILFVVPVILVSRKPSVVSVADAFTLSF